MYENQMLYLQAVIFQVKHKTSSHIQNSQFLNRYTTSTSTKKKIRKDKNKRDNFWILTLEPLTPKGLNQELN